MSSKVTLREALTRVSHSRHTVWKDGIDLGVCWDDCTRCQLEAALATFTPQEMAPTRNAGLNEKTIYAEWLETADNKDALDFYEFAAKKYLFSAQATQSAGTVSEEQAQLIAHDILGPAEGVLCADDEVWRWMHGRVPNTVFMEIIKRIVNALLRQPASAPAKGTANTVTMSSKTAEDTICVVENGIPKFYPRVIDQAKSTTPVVQPDAQVMERAREVVSNLYAAFHCSQCHRYEENELTKGIATLVTRERDAARLATLEQAAVIAERCVSWYEGKGDEVGKHVADEIRALAAKEQP